jgi:hypothetical protein
VFFYPLTFSHYPMMDVLPCAIKFGGIDEISAVF